MSDIKVPRALNTIKLNITYDSLSGSSVTVVFFFILRTKRVSETFSSVNRS